MAYRLLHASFFPLSLYLTYKTTEDTSDGDKPASSSLGDARSTSLSSSAASLACCVSTVAGRVEYTHVLSSLFPASLYLTCSQKSSRTR